MDPAPAILAWRSRCLAGIGRRADIDVERALAVEGDAFVAVLLHAWQTADHGFGGARWSQLARRHLVPLDRVELGDI